MVDPAKLSKGDRVHYIGHPGAKPENGMFKAHSDSNNHVFVVFNCAGEWDNFENYTAQSTPVKNLHPGWSDE